MRRREKTDGNKETDMEGEAGAKQLRERLLNAQKILVLTQNGIEEQGTHEELLAKNGVYAKLYRG